MNISLQGRGGVMAWLQRCAGCVALLGLLAPVAAGSAPLAEPDARAVRQVIEAQLDAFAADDAERAFSYASPAIRAQFGDANTFIGMVRGGYPMVLRPTAVSFFQARTVDGADMTVSQPVHLRDREGRLWLAAYVLEQQAGGGWRINVCVVVADSGRSLT
jgi:Domain of unknown function (DUF4864)